MQVLRRVFYIRWLLENLEALLAGDFPEEMQELFQSKDGLFPAPWEISFKGRFIDVTLANRVEAMLANVGNKSSRIMDDDEIAGMFGVL